MTRSRPVRRRAFPPARVIAAAVAAALPLMAGCDEPLHPGRPMPGQIVADPENPVWLRYHEDGPFFLCGPGDPEGFLYRGALRPDGTRDGDQRELIEKLASTGANGIYLMAVRSHGGDGDPRENPFLEHDPSRGLNPRVLDQWEEWFSEMDRNGIVVFFIFYDDEARPWGDRSSVGAEERRFLTALVDRFEHHRHWIWVVAEEYSEALSAAAASTIAATIRQADDHDHPIAVHKKHGLDFSEFADDPNVDQFAIQYNVRSATELHAGLLTAWDRAAGRYNLNLAEAKPWGTGAESRRKIWAAAMAGAYVMVLGWDIAGTPRGDLRACGRLVRFLESTDLGELAPSDDLAAGDTEYVLARPGRAYVLYASSGRGPLGLREIPAGAYRLRWHEVPSGEERVVDGTVVEGGTTLFPRPDGAEGELALYLTREPARSP